MSRKTIGIVNTTYGPVKGVELQGDFDGITTFRSIPYAAAPTGDLRWKPPVDPERWTEVRVCETYGDICPQPYNRELDQEPYSSDFYYMGNPKMSEDCLHLTITTGAASSDEKRPVYVWFHGGGSDHGYAYEVEFDPSVLAKKGIVVVSVNHRLGAFGYMALPQILEEQGKCGNYILLDNEKALRWIVENIAAFGGDPDNITLGGQSAGCGKSVSLAMTPFGREHVKRIINESWLIWLSKNNTMEQEIAIWQEYLRQIGIDPDLPLSELRKIDALRFVPEDPKIGIPGGLVCDGEMVPNIQVADSMAEYGGRFDFLTGNNVGESHMKPDAVWGTFGFTKAEEFYQYYEETFPELAVKYPVRETFHLKDEETDYVTRRLAGKGLAVRKWGGTMLNLHFGEYRKKKCPDKNTFVYLFRQVPPVLPEEKGTIRDDDLLLSWHSSELFYAFDSMRPGIPPKRPWKEEDYHLADTMSTYWANFIASGDPNGEGLPEWPECDERKGYLELGTPITAHRDLDQTEDRLVYEYVMESTVFPE